ncbi:biotin--[acetyl-CoA-carboxylase] ligase [Hyphomicrobium facile]|uniref:BirA family transcriptional regulator, biotin operon repressor / biotin-[acetyl-CoA-carboxylase] ligase n=1 Tax=Hyphomicrobium facile TaxID=51670 RepID=A0A1I7NGE0_9HYPH|nr:biotin--[acetyl-CoA-carboxylase] ligase [Hyphomicrobium facile]SFV33616.1 BirA family transcriptional regulator, biotin operon repressor / biotin-[acetyl-CoA-carboxylase] ligase [Hyphomicrobium facile]
MPRIVHLAETASTNADAMRLGLSGEELPLWVIADTQTGGRGRSGRAWVSEPGNLHASVAFRSDAPLEKAGQLSLLAGIAVIDAVRATMDLAPGTELRLKWPNDILIGSAKAGGILVESTSVRAGPGFLAILGFGLNLISAPDSLGRAVTALSQHGKSPEPLVFLEMLAEKVAFWLDRWQAGEGFAAIREAWMERAGAMGERIAINTAAGQLSATYQGLSETGALRADVGGTIKEISYGDVLLVGQIARDGTP